MRHLPRVVFLEPPVTLIPRPLPKQQTHPSIEDNGAVDDDRDDVSFEPSSASFGSQRSASTSSEGQGSMSSQQRPGSAESADQQSEATDNGGLHTSRSKFNTIRWYKYLGYTRTIPLYVHVHIL